MCDWGEDPGAGATLRLTKAQREPDAGNRQWGAEPDLTLELRMFHTCSNTTLSFESSPENSFSISTVQGQYLYQRIGHGTGKDRKP